MGKWENGFFYNIWIQVHAFFDHIGGISNFLVKLGQLLLISDDEFCILLISQMVEALFLRR